LEYGALEDLGLFVDDNGSLQSANGLRENEIGNTRISSLKPSNFQDLEKFGSVFIPGPDIGRFSSRRSFFGHSKWSTIGITHTTSSIRVMDGIGDLLMSPVQPWDAVICTSQTVKSHAMEILEAKKNYLVHRFGIQKLPQINLPVIPLGVDTRRFEPLIAEKASARAALNIAEDEVAVSFVGRLSWHAKAHPIPMYLAISEAAKATGKNIVMIECGWHANDAARQAFEETQSLFSGSLRFMYVDGRTPEAVNNVYAASDIFMSLSDNIQETFGITPIEAMSAGVPVIVSDWDGYRDTVRDGVDGFKIKTLAPEATHQQDLIYRYEMGLDTYDYYCGHTSMSNAVDVGDLTEKLTELVESPPLRRKMGAAGQARARAVFDWSVIIKQYASLWDELENVRNHNSDETMSQPTIWPERLDPMIGFKQYPSARLRSEDKLERGAASGQLLDQIMNDHMVTYAKQVVPNADAVKAAMDSLDGSAFTVGELALALAPGSLALGMRLVATLIKFDVVRLLRSGG
jgi:glycosyltransferase involved in cell wall biosynthesis